MTAHTSATTATPRGAQAHARQQADTVVETMPVLPPSAWPEPPAGVRPDQLTWAETVAGGGYTSLYAQPGATVRLTDLRGDACAHLLVYNALSPAERLNIADTIKVQWQAYPTTGSVLLSDLGRALMTVTSDSSAHHDTLCGTTSRLANATRYGDGSAQGPAPAGRELFTLAATKHGLSARDVAPSLSLFQGVRAAADGTLAFAGSAGPGGCVELVAELPVLILIANTAHPLDPREQFTCSPLQVLSWSAGSTAEAPADRTPEAARAVLNTSAYLRMRGLVPVGAP